jgi:hypothetical protein
MVERNPLLLRSNQGPVITLLAGLVTAIALFVLGANAATDELNSRNASANVAPPATTAPAPPATTAPAAPAKVRVAYAGRVDGGAATIAIALRDGAAIAYLCDGRRVEEWMIGTAADGKLSLSGDDAVLTGSYDKDSAAGTVTAGNKNWTLDIPVAKKPTGLYRSTADIRNARVVTGWIVLANGEQVGVSNTEGKLAPAPRLGLPSGSATVNGSRVTADSIDGSTGAGF